MTHRSRPRPRTPGRADSRPETEVEGHTPTELGDSRDALYQALSTRAGEVATAERRRALRTFDDGTGVSPAAQRVLSTMAVRLAVKLLRPAVDAVETDDHRTETVADLFLDE